LVETEIPAARKERIRALVSQRGIVSLQAVKAELGVSEMTIRRDFAALEQSGLVQRTRGGVMAVGGVAVDRTYDERQQLERDAKEAIGRLAATVVEDGDTIFLSGGTTPLALARSLVERRDVTVITNSVAAVYELMGAPGITVIATGGVASSKGEDMCGPLAEAALEKLRARKAFIGSSGITIDGIFNTSIERAAVDRVMIANAAEVHVLGDHTKIGRVSLARVASLARLTSLITDAQLVAPAADWMSEAGVRVLVADGTDHPQSAAAQA
jgi:DeoR/GlpR family transcriptional regulator of sugar metabolism